MTYAKNYFDLTSLYNIISFCNRYDIEEINLSYYGDRCIMGHLENIFSRYSIKINWK